MNAVHLNFEFKAQIAGIEQYEEKLLKLNPKYIGLDHQKDTYFNANKGRLKLREGNIENSLIQYERENVADSKLSKILLYEHRPHPALKDILTDQLGVTVVVVKKRKIYFVDNVKFHFDIVDGLGTFLEVEAIESKERRTIEALKEQCSYYFEFFKLKNADLIGVSYSDLLLEKV